MSSPARLLLSYLAAFRFPFSREQIMMLLVPETLVVMKAPQKYGVSSNHGQNQDEVSMVNSEEEVILPAVLTENWRAARDELVQTSFMQFDGQIYAIHPQVRYFALSLLPLEERRRVHRLVVRYDCEASPS